MASDQTVPADDGAARREVKQLQDTVVRLREELEQAVSSQNRLVAEVVSARDEEIRQLRDTVAILRAKLEHANTVPPPGSPDVEAGQQLNRHLQGTIQKMRGQLEQLWAEKTSREDELTQGFEKERRYFHETIAALRKQLEEHHDRR